jgi:hypothetical protein
MEHIRFDKICLKCNKKFTVPNWRKNAKFCCYNCWATGHTQTKETRKKISLSKFGTPSPFKGKKRPEFSGKNNPMANPEYRKRVSLAKKGIPHLNQRGKNNGNWNGGRKKYNGGYVDIYMPDYTFNKIHKVYVHEHRFVAEKCLGRRLSDKEIIHHINEIKDDNRPENLYVFNSRREHVLYHRNPYPLKSNLYV